MICSDMSLLFFLLCCCSCVYARICCTLSISTLSLLSIPSTALLPSPSSVQHTGSISLEDVYSIARTMRPRSIAKEFLGTVKETLGMAQSVGCKVEGKHSHDWIDTVNEGTLEVPVSAEVLDVGGVGVGYRLTSLVI